MNLLWLAIPTSTLAEKRSPLCVVGNSLRRPSNVWYAKSWWTCKSKAITSGMNDWNRRLQGVVLFDRWNLLLKQELWKGEKWPKWFRITKWVGFGPMNDSWKYLILNASLCDCFCFVFQSLHWVGFRNASNHPPQHFRLAKNLGKELLCFTAISPTQSSWKINTNLKILKNQSTPPQAYFNSTRQEPVILCPSFVPGASFFADGDASPLLLARSSGSLDIPEECKL